MNNETSGEQAGEEDQTELAERSPEAELPAWLAFDGMNTPQELEREFAFRVAGQELESRMGNRLVELAKTARIDGFRHGHVPLAVVRRRWGDAVRGEELEKLVEHGCRAITSSHSLRLSDRVRVTDLEEQKDAESAERAEGIAGFDPKQGIWKVAAACSVYPEVQFSEVEGGDKISVESLKLEGTPEQIEERADSIRSSLSPLEELEAGQAEKDDSLGLDLQILNLEGEELREQSPAELVLDEGRLPPEIFAALKGSAVGAEGTTEVTTTAANGQQDTLVWKWTLKTLRRRALLDWDADELREKVMSLRQAVERQNADDSGDGDEGKDADGDAAQEDTSDVHALLLSDCRQQMEREAQAINDRRLRDQIFQGLCDLYPLPMPKSAVERELQQAQQGGAQTEQDPEQTPEYPPEVWENAQTRVRLGVLIAAYAEKHNLQVDNEWLEQRIDQDAARQQDPAAFRHQAMRSESYLAGLESEGIQEKVFRTFLETAEQNEKTVDYEQLQAIAKQPV